MSDDSRQGLEPGTEVEVEAEAEVKASTEDTEAILSRRGFLIRSGLASAGVVAAGCGPKSKPQPCLSREPVRKPDAEAARPCLKVRAPQDAGAARPCLKVRPQPCLKVKPQPCLSKPPPPMPPPRICLSVPKPKDKP